MMRCIDHPTMLKDGSGWGSMCGVVAGVLAAQGFTGAPALTFENDAPEWKSLGDIWLMRELYFKPYACCRWSQPAVQAARDLTQSHNLPADAISLIEVHSFAAAIRLATSRPQNTEEAQYSLPYPVAATIIDGKLDPEQVTPPRIFDEDVLSLADRITMHIDESLENRFPEEALAKVVIHTKDGRTLQSEVCRAPGDPANPLSDEELADKFYRLVRPVLGREQAAALYAACHDMPPVREFVKLLC
jgi:2-methylcitrate dehydratase PrpD